MEETFALPDSSLPTDMWMRCIDTEAKLINFFIYHEIILPDWLGPNKCVCGGTYRQRKDRARSFMCGRCKKTCLFYRNTFFSNCHMPICDVISIGKND